MSIVFDSSALLMLLHKEPGYEKIEPYLSKAIMSAVNVAEVLTVLGSIGISSTDASTITSELLTEIVSFDATQAATCATLRETTKTHGLSLGDRACLSLALHKKMPVLTADKIWSKIQLPIEIILVR